MPDLKIEVGFGVKGREDFLFLEDSYLVMSGLTKDQVDDCLRAEAEVDSDLMPVEVWAAIMKFVEDFRKVLKADFPEFEFTTEYTYGFEVIH